MEPLLDIELLSGFAPDPTDQADLLQTMLESLRNDIGQLDQPLDAETLHRQLHTLKGYLCYATRAPVWQSLSDWCERTRKADPAQAAAFVKVWPQIRPQLLELAQAIEAWLSRYHSR